MYEGKCPLLRGVRYQGMNITGGPEKNVLSKEVRVKKMWFNVSTAVFNVLHTYVSEYDIACTIYAT